MHCFVHIFNYLFELWVKIKILVTLTHPGEEKVTIFAWRQENVTTIKSADVLRGQGHL